MTGVRRDPCNGVTLSEQAQGVSPLSVSTAQYLDIEVLCRAMGADEVETIDAQDAASIRKVLRTAVKHEDKLSTFVFRSPCHLIDRSTHPQHHIVDCSKCGTCI